MQRSSAYLLIVRTHIDEKIAIARIVRSRLRRKLVYVDKASDSTLRSADRRTRK